MKEQNEIEQLFSSAFDGFEVTPPAKVKAAIDESIFAEKVLVHKRKGFIWLFPLLGIFFIIGFIGLSFNTLYASKTSNQTANSAFNSTSHDPSSQNHQSKYSGHSQNTLIRKKTKELNATPQRNGEGIEISTANGTDYSASKSFKSSKKTLHSEETGLSSIKTRSNKQGKKAWVSASKKQKSSNNKIRKIKTDKLLGSTVNIGNDGGLGKTKIGVDGLVASIDYSEKPNTEIESTNHFAEQDSSLISMKDTLKLSLKNGVVEGQNLRLNIPQPKWTVSLYNGTFYGVNKLTQSSLSNYEMSSRLGVYSGLEVAYSFSQKWAVNSGINYMHYSDNLVEQFSDTTEIQNGYSVQYIYNNPLLQDSIIDSVVTVEYITQINYHNYGQKIKYNIFSIPIYASFTFFEKGNWMASATAGMRFNFYTAKIVSAEGTITNPTFKKVGSTLALRPEVSYTFGKMGIGIYLNSSYDLTSIAQWPEFTKKRFDLGGGVVLKYRF